MPELKIRGTNWREVEADVSFQIYNVDQRRYAAALNFAKRGEFHAIDPDIYIKHFTNLHLIHQEYVANNPVEGLKQGFSGLGL
jgi:hypothetical protein